MRREPQLLVSLAAAALALGAAGCRKREPASEPAPREAAEAGKGAAAAPPPLASAAFYRIDAGPQTPCAAGATCEARLVLTALGAYKVNKEYPFKFVIDASVSGVLIEGTGTFAFDDAKTGTMTLKFRPARAGRAKLAGKFKLSVCSADVCEIEQPMIELELPVT